MLTSPDLLDRARAGDEQAFEALVAPLRRRLLTFSYQMLGSLDEAEDVLQETMLRAWQGIDRFEGRSSLGTWLQAIATRRCLTAIDRRRRALPMDYGSPAPTGTPTGATLPADAWIDPFPEEDVTDPGTAEPSARYEMRESVELAFIAAVQHLSANQRAVLLLRDVLGFSAKETAEALDTTIGSANSALQRARRRIEERLPRHSQQETLRALGDGRVAEIVERYGRAWEAGDVEAVVALLSDDATFTMPPLSTWFKGKEAITAWLADESLTAQLRWRVLPVRVNGQVALAYYCWHEAEERFLPFALNVLTFDGDRIGAVTAFIFRTVTKDPNLSREPAGEARDVAAFRRFGLPAALPAAATG